MLKNYFKIALRNLKANKFYSISKHKRAGCGFGNRNYAAALGAE